ncbi:NaeI family type II restriction endonuclease [Corynebacterium felinum]|uniref:Type II restriction enzyme NaeI domain-containing protein n=1 Tax=Corynebacterium felinum TaxID=131318 RepID=A0ABU2B9K6_9CORY|nr:NaeI family type II restriction endonuclease [Corynebacterium felinum]MDF5821905.1 NaeI family type II restriction endonuclease [Corynebacterium felinum]MDR7355283.1 hypothetical protein [Corynebacterium felinum]WJY94636.1 Type-2 restriction enzyme NaeI [Corynebacterium felinum]
MSDLSSSSVPAPDPVSLELAQKLMDFDPDGVLCARAIRKALDLVYDGQHTGRFSIDQVTKTEAAHVGSLVEIYLRRALDGFLSDGVQMDFAIDGVDVDCKYSKHPFGWMIPREALGHFAVVVHADDRTSYWHLGFVRITESILTQGKNRDLKRSITAKGRSAIAWCWQANSLPENILLKLPQDVVDGIMGQPSGAKRVDELFRRTLGRIVSRNVIATVAQQEDYMKRVRYNGGSRSRLAPEGIIILGGDYLAHRKIAEDLNIVVPNHGEMVAIRLSSNCNPTTPHTAIINNTHWCVASENDLIESAPKVPNPSSRN